MKKIIIIISIIIITLVFSGCTAQENSNNQQESTTPLIENVEEAETNILKTEDFVITLPSFYEESDGYINPKEPDAFPQIKYSSYENKENIKTSQLLERQKEGFNNLCTQTESCPEIIKNEVLIINKVVGVYILTINTAPPIGDDTRKQFGHRYIFAESDKIFNFIIYEYGEEPSEEFEETIGNIIKTIRFKNSPLEIEGMLFKNNKLLLVAKNELTEDQKKIIEDEMNGVFCGQTEGTNMYDLCLITKMNDEEDLQLMFSKILENEFIENVAAVDNFEYLF